MTAKALKQFKRMADTAQERIDKFTVDFAKDPAYALNWGDSVFQSAARLKVAKELVTALEGPCTLEQARDALMHRAARKVRRVDY